MDDEPSVRILARIVALHQPRKTGGSSPGRPSRYCAECGFPYPCRTVVIARRGVRLAGEGSA